MMRSLLMGIVLLLSLQGAGCQMYGLAARNAVFETALAVDCTAEFIDYRQLAKKAAEEHLGGDPNHQGSEDYEKGFIEGYAYYLKEGGSGNAPLVPPARYWHFCWLTPAGYEAIQEWHAGYQAGLAFARSSGLRNTLTVPFLAPGHGPLVPEVSVPAPSLGDPLPLPRKVSTPSSNEAQSKPSETATPIAQEKPKEGKCEWAPPPAPIVVKKPRPKEDKPAGTRPTDDRPMVKGAEMDSYLESLRTYSRKQQEEAKTSP